MPKTHPFTVEFVSVWDGGYQITSSCELDLDTLEIVDIEVVDVDDSLNSCDSQHINVTVGDNTQSFDIVEDDEYLVDEDEKERLFNFIRQ